MTVDAWYACESRILAWCEAVLCRGTETSVAAKVSIGPNQISANPADINSLSGYSSDPRTVDKLVDRINRTNDDLHMWLAPFTQGRHHTVTITFRDVSIFALTTRGTAVGNSWNCCLDCSCAVW
jgi:hypothetical protein